MQKIKIGAVSYLNTKPLLYGMQNELFLQTHELLLDYPAHIGEALEKGMVDVALIPTALLHNFPEAHIVSRYGIAADQDVASVCLFSELPVEELEVIYTDYQSRSSTALLKILIKEFWNSPAQLLDTTDETYRTKIKGTTGALVIGDRAFEQRRLSTYIYDLASEWKAMTGLPFVFAAWVSLQPMEEQWMQQFDAANAVGLGMLETIAEAQKFSSFDLLSYYRHHIAYELTPERMKGLQRFLELLKTG